MINVYYYYIKDYACFQVRDDCLRLTGAPVLWPTDEPFRLLFLYFEVDRELQSCDQPTNLLDCFYFIFRLASNEVPSGVWPDLCSMGVLRTSVSVEGLDYLCH